MQTIPTPAATPLTGGVQTPLLTETQLEPGMFIAGPTGQHVWRIDAVTLRENTVMLCRQPESAPAPGHEHQFGTQTSGFASCPCGYRKQNIRGDQGLLPLREQTPRVYLIRSRAPLVAPDAFTVYLTASGGIITVNNGVWALLPVIPTLHPVWTLPEALRERLR